MNQVSDSDTPSGARTVEQLDAAILNHRRAIEELEAEARALRLKANADRRNAGVVHASPTTLLEGMPPELFPIRGDDRAPERQRLKRWCEDHLVGQKVEWTETVDRVTVSAEKSSYEVSLFLRNEFWDAQAQQPVYRTTSIKYTHKDGLDFYATGRLFRGPPRDDTGGAASDDATPPPHAVDIRKDCEVFLSSNCFLTDRLVLEKCTEQEATQLRSLKGEATFSVTIVGVVDVFANGVMLRVTVPAIDGMLPLSCAQTAAGAAVKPAPRSGRDYWLTPIFDGFVPQRDKTTPTKK
jgi:hypothetical protein